MQFNISPSDKAYQLLLLHGVPRSLLNKFSLNIDKSLGNLEIVGKQRSRIILANQQQQWFEKIYRDTATDHSIIICASSEFYLNARRAGLILFWRYLSQSLNYPKRFSHSKPLWYAPDLGFRNRLVEEYNNGKHHRPNLLLIDNVYDEMPASKIDKVRDLLQCFCDRPCLLIINSRDPYGYCLNKLGARPTRLINFARQLRREVI